MLNEEKKEAIKEIKAIENKNKLPFKKWLIQYSWISFGVFITTIGYYFFLKPGKIVAGGISGIAIIFEPLWEGSWFQTSYFLYALEVICLILGLIFIGKDFFFKTVYASLLYPSIIFLYERVFDANLIMGTFEESPHLLAMALGAILTGGGVGIALRHNGSTGGIDVIQKIISKYAKIPLSQTMYFTDWVIVILAGLTFSPFGYKVELVVYGSIAVIIESYIVDYIALSIKPRRTVYVISNTPQLIKDLIYKELNRGVTFSPVLGAYTNKERTMVICTMDKNEAYRVVGMISSVDPKAFTFVTSCKEVRGEYDKRGLF